MDTNDYREGQENGTTDQNTQGQGNEDTQARNSQSQDTQSQDTQSQNNQGQYTQGQYNQNQYGQNQYNQYNPYGYGQQPNYQGYYGYYGNTYPGSQDTRRAQKKKGNGALKAVAAVLMVICLLGGIVLGVVFYPNFTGKTQHIVSSTDSQKDNTPKISENDDSQSLTTDRPSIGGTAPVFDSSQDRIVQIAKKLSPSVVFIGIRYKETYSDISPEPGVSPESEATPQSSDEVFNAGGTGIIASQDGYIVTNNHVVEGADTIVVKLFSGKEYDAKIVGLNVQNDIAVIKIDAQGLSPAAFGDSDSLQVGESVVAIGTPVDQSLQGTVTSGIISALNREIDVTSDEGNTAKHSYLQTDAAINPGNSGGPLINMNGQVIGINAGKISTAEIDPYTGQQISAEGIGFAIPINLAIPVIQQLETNGRVGIGITCVLDKTNKYNPSGSHSGVTIITVTDGGPAAEAGLKPNDILSNADGKELKSVEDLLIIIQGHKVGDVMNVTYWRSGKSYTADITVGDLNQMSK